jgi:hypothetical protein
MEVVLNCVREEGEIEMRVGIICRVLLPGAACLASAQTTQSTTSATTVPNRIAIVGGIAGGPIQSNMITGQPYSAQQETQTIQTLEDGTHITNGVQKVKLYRDSQGRTRTERTAQQPPGVLSASTPPVFIEVSDPVAGYRYTFDSTSQRAYRSPSAPLRVPKPVALPAQIPAGVPVARAVIMPAPVSGPNQIARPEVVTEQLPAQSIEGVLAEGTRTTTTYPTGFLGNDRPVTTTNEAWTSRELGMQVLTKVSDPRSGVTTMRLFNISRAEPDASLFQPPAGYEVVDPQVDLRK